MKDQGIVRSKSSSCSGCLSVQGSYALKSGTISAAETSMCPSTSILQGVILPSKFTKNRVDHSEEVFNS